MSPKLIDKEQRKTEIALVALDLFAKDGFEKTSISSVAKAAGIGKGTVYEYFESKEDLIGAALFAWVQDMKEQSSEEFFQSIDNPEERLRKCVQAMTEAFIHDERTVKLMIGLFQMMLKDGEFFPHNKMFRGMFRMIRQLFIDILLDGVSQGVFKSEIARDVQKIAINSFAYLDGIALHYFLNKEDFDLMQQVDFYLDRLLRDIKEVRHA